MGVFSIIVLVLAEDARAAVYLFAAYVFFSVFGSWVLHSFAIKFNQVSYKSVLYFFGVSLIPLFLGLTLITLGTISAKSLTIFLIWSFLLVFLTTRINYGLSYFKTLALIIITGLCIASVAGILSILARVIR